MKGFLKGRGIGDWGNYDVWKEVDRGEGSVSLVLKEESEKGDWEGNYEGGKKNWNERWKKKKKWKGKG